MHIKDLQKAVGFDGTPVGLSLNTSFAPKLPNSQPWCVAAPDALASLGVTAGAYVLVTVTNQVAGGAVGSTSPQLSKATSPMAVSSFAPVSMPSLQSPTAQILPVWQQFKSAAVTASLEQQQGMAAALPGQLAVPSQIWPSSKLPRGLVCVSQSLRQQLAGPTESTVLGIIPWKTTQSTCAQLTIRLCQDMVKCQVVTLDQASQDQAAATPSTPLGTPTPNKGRPGSGHSRTQAMTTPKATMRQAGGDKTPSKTPNAQQAATTAPPVTPALGDWVLTLLQPAGGKAGKDVKTSQLSAEQRGLLNSLIMQRLGARMVLQGNPMSVPLFGHTLLCEVVHMRDAAGQPITCGMVNPQNTSIEFLLPGEVMPDAQVLDNKPHALPESVQGVSVGLPTGRRLVLQELISAARQAAEDSAKDSSTAEAAATAAQRAVIAGWSAAGLNYSSLGGVSHLVSSLRQLVTLPLKAPHLLKSLRVRPPRGVLLYGPPGSGKTVLARAAAGDAGAVLLVVNGPDVMSEFMGESEAGLQGVFAAARALAPAIVFIDEIDAIAPARGGGPGDSGIASSLAGGGSGSDTASRLVTTLLTCLDGVGAGHHGDGVVVIGATNRPDALDSALRRPGRLDRELEVGAPPPEARLEILHTRLKTVRHSLTQQELQDIALSAHGFVAADLAALVNEAALTALRRAVQKHDRQHPTSADTPDQIESDSNHSSSEVAVDYSDFVAARARVRPSSLRELAVEIPRVAWDDVGGLHDVKQRLQEAVVLPFKQPQALARLGAVPPRGVLLYGPPGCSKTLLAKVVAAEARLNFLSIKGGELFSKFVGESEKAISALFTRARATAPTIIFFDEIDSLATARSADSSGASVADRVMAQLLTEMDGLQQRVGVVVLAATNRPDCIDAALLRPGRFDRLIYVPPPDEQARIEILKVHLKRTPIGQDVDLNTLSSMTAGFSGADLGALVREAALAALQESLDSHEVCLRHFNAALELVIPSAMPTPDMEAMYHQFSSAGLLPGKAAVPVFGR